MIRVLAIWFVLLAGLILSFIAREENLIAQGKIPAGRLRRIWLKEERRCAPRYRLNWAVKYRRSNGASPASGQTRDVSQTGAALIVREKLEPGSLIRLELMAPENPTPVHVSCKVIWVRPVPPKDHAYSEERLFFMGIQFEEGNPTAQRWLVQALPSSFKTGCTPSEKADV